MKRKVNLTPDRSLRPYEFAADNLIEHCLAIIQRTPEGEQPYIICPTDLKPDTKKNKTRFSMSDSTSPMGVIVRGDALAGFRYPEAAAARFNAYDLAAWAVKQRTLMEVNTGGETQNGDPSAELPTPER